MKNVDDLIEDASELAARGLSKGEIADELNVSRETASWLVDRGDSETTRGIDPVASAEPETHDIHVDWSAIGRDSERLGYVARAMADLLTKQGDAVDLTIGIEKAGAPLSTIGAQELNTDLGSYAPAKNQWEEGDFDELGGPFSRNFAQIRDRDCYVVDDTITSGTTMAEAVEAIREAGGSQVTCVDVVAKKGVEEINGAPVYSLNDVARVDSTS